MADILSELQTLRALLEAVLGARRQTGCNPIADRGCETLVQYLYYLFFIVPVIFCNVCVQFVCVALVVLVASEARPEGGAADAGGTSKGKMCHSNVS